LHSFAAPHAAPFSFRATQTPSTHVASPSASQSASVEQALQSFSEQTREAQSVSVAQGSPFAQAGQSPPPQSTPVSAPFFASSTQVGGTQVPAPSHAPPEQASPFFTSEVEHAPSTHENERQSVETPQSAATIHDATTGSSGALTREHAPTKASIALTKVTRNHDPGRASTVVASLLRTSTSSAPPPECCIVFPLRIRFKASRATRPPDQPRARLA
jgi:hypothetical protein